MKSRKFSVECSAGAIRGEIVIDGHDDRIPGLLLDDIVAQATKGMSRVLVPRLSSAEEFIGGALEKLDEPVEYPTTVTLELLGFNIRLDVTVDFPYELGDHELALQAAAVNAIAPAMARFAIDEISNAIMMMGMQSFADEHPEALNNMGHPRIVAIPTDGAGLVGTLLGSLSGALRSSAHNEG